MDFGCIFLVSFRDGSSRTLNLAGELFMSQERHPTSSSFIDANGRTGASHLLTWRCLKHSEHKHTQNSLLMSIHFRVLRGPSGPSGSFGSKPPLTPSLCLCPWALPCHGLAITAKGTWALKQTWQWEIPHKWALKWDYCLWEMFNCHICLPPKGTSFYPTDPRTGSTWCLQDQHEQFKSVTFQNLPSSRIQQTRSPAAFRFFPFAFAFDLFGSSGILNLKASDIFMHLAHNMRKPENASWISSTKIFKNW